MLDALRKIFETVGNNFYKKGITVTLVDQAETAYCEGDNITLPIPLLEEFTQNKLPRFTVFYHELGHSLYSGALTKFIERWSNLPGVATHLAFDRKYMHLLNWLEDFYIEEQLEIDYAYLKDILSCLKRLPETYDINAIDKAFNHYYKKGYTTPALNVSQAFTFKNYINTLLGIRKHPAFGAMPISLLSNKSTGATFIKTFIDFYNFCVQNGILQDTYMPPMSNPNNILVPDPNAQQNPSTGGSSNGGSSSAHSQLVGGFKEVFPDVDASSTQIFVDQFTAENKLIKEELANRNQVESTHTSLDGLFTSLFQDTSIIQNKVIVKNFFNPNRLVDGVLFKSPKKAFNNVSIYRDISGSTESASIFPLINNICKYLIEKIPISTHFYLYSSGNISILETQYQDWEDYHTAPELYQLDPVYQQFGGGTNSDAIADVISEQLNDKWLNIVVTDGDLRALFKRQNIKSLLDNIFVIAVDDIGDTARSMIDPSHYIRIDNTDDIDKLCNALLRMKGE